jgi:hypothetical protein
VKLKNNKNIKFEKIISETKKTFLFNKILDFIELENARLPIPLLFEKGMEW